MTYDIASRITQLSFTSLVGAYGISNYSYDNTNQLTAADHTGTGMPADESNSFDVNGNRTSTGYTTGANNRLTSDGIWNYETDDEGNRTAQERISTAQANDKRIEFTWDHRNRLTKILYKNNAGTVTKQIDYRYDVFDRRIEKNIDADGAGSGSATVARYIYDGESIILAFDAADKLTNRYLHGPVVDQIFADEQFVNGLTIGVGTTEGDTLWALTDYLGSVRDLVDNDGNVENHLVYDSFGQITSETNTALDSIYAYTGRERDEESHLQFNRARYYDASTGRWISEDPIGFAAGDPNLVRYVANSPTNATDPSGMMPPDYGQPWGYPGTGMAPPPASPPRDNGGPWGSPSPTTGMEAPVDGLRPIGSSAADGLPIVVGIAVGIGSAILVGPVVAPVAGTGVIGGVIVGGVGGAAGGAGQQGTAIGLGVQDEWSWRDLTISVATGGVIGGVGRVISGVTSRPPVTQPPRPGLPRPADLAPRPIPADEYNPFTDPENVLFDIRRIRSSADTIPFRPSDTLPLP